MNETDDRLVGDPVWELFPKASATSEAEGSRARRYRPWLALIAGVTLAWFLSPPVSVVMVCLAAAARDLRAGGQLARSVPDKAGGDVCARFAYAWGIWKLGVTAFVLMFVTMFLAMPLVETRSEPPPAFLTACLLWMGGLTASAVLTALGLAKALRSGMRIWIGEGINQARTLLLGMLLMGFFFFVIGPICFWLVAAVPPAGVPSDAGVPITLMFIGVLFVGPVALLLVLDGLCRRIVADRPGKFGPKVPTVGKWNPDSGGWDADGP